MKDDLQIAESGAELPDQGEGPFPGHIETSRQYTDQLFIDGCRVVANGSALFARGSVFAIKPFPKSKTGFTIEVRFDDDPRDKKQRLVKTPDYAKDTLRCTFFNYTGVIAPSLELANYRGKKVMGILHGQIIGQRPCLWSLDYTLFLAPNKNQKKH